MRFHRKALPVKGKRVECGKLHLPLGLPANLVCGRIALLCLCTAFEKRTISKHHA